MQSKFALDFGEVFARLATRPRASPWQGRAKLVHEAATLLSECDAVLATPKGGGKYRVMREAQKRDCEQTLALLERCSGLSGAASERGEAKR